MIDISIRKQIMDELLRLSRICLDEEGINQDTMKFFLKDLSTIFWKVEKNEFTTINEISIHIDKQLDGLFMLDSSDPEIDISIYILGYLKNFCEAIKC